MANSVEDQWKKWKAEHSKSYDTEQEEKKRFEFFKDNINKVEEHNKKYETGEVTWTMGINQFSDLGPGEDPCGHSHSLLKNGNK